MKTPLRHIIVVLNPSSGTRKAVRALGAVLKAFDRPGFRSSVHVLKGPGEALETAGRAAKEKAWALVVGGGDGTLNEVLPALAGSRTRLGLLPPGAGNGFARGLGIPLNVEKACKVILAGRTKRVDAGVLNGKKLFLNVFGCGFDAQVAKTSNDLRWISRFHGPLRYFVAGIASLAALRLPRLHVEADGLRYEQEVLLLAV